VPESANARVDKKNVENRITKIEIILKLER
jgi:hypothetical protein